MKPCPGCGKRLSLLTLAWLRGSKRAVPASCDKCGLLIRNTWPGFLCGFGLGLASMFAMLLSDYSDDWSSLIKILVSLLLMGFWSVVFAQPTPYIYEKYCHICGKPDAQFVSDWHSVCVKCRGAVDDG